jgi:FkbH-like protein
VKLTEALKILQQAPKNASPFHVALACGFTPLHVQTFLAAHLQQRLADRQVTVSPGLYGDLLGTLASLKGAAVDGAALPLEWEDLDPRLGYRGAGDWGAPALPGILSDAMAMLDRIAAALEEIRAEIPIAVSLPTLPLPPIFHTAGWQAAEAELALERKVAEFASRIVRRGGCSLVNSARLAEDSPPAGRFDFQSDLLTGLPYTLPHAAAVGSALARLLAPPLPKKALITDLDDTLWRGVVGEIGPEKVSWDLASHSQLHGLYQKLLASLAGEGVLIGVASKNDPAVVRQAFEREDMLLPPGRVFPLEVHWGAKSGSVGRILRTWNISADSVVFVDDSAMELAEVAAAHPGIECLSFPKTDYAAGYAMLRRLRDLFGKPRISQEDAIRLESIRQSVPFQQADGGPASETFLQQADASITFDFSHDDDPRALELVNKTNQFNLNGIRYTEADWKNRLSRPGALRVVVSYRDKFGPLGKIAVLEGRQEGETLFIDTWVMSCRAFSRRIEHRCLQAMFERYAAREIFFAFQPTPKNGPLQDFLAAIAGRPPAAPFTLERSQFEEKRPPLYHRAVESPTMDCIAMGNPAKVVRFVTRPE